jgi:uncharacterized membrane protein
MKSDDLPPDGQHGGEPGGSDDVDVTGEPVHKDFAEFADRAQFAEFAERAHFAEFAEHETRQEHDTARDVEPPREGVKPAAESGADKVPAARLEASGRATADGQPDLLHLHEMLHRLDRAASLLQAAGRARLRPQDRPEPRWPVSAAVIAAIVLQWFLPRRLVWGVGGVHYILLGLEIALILALFAANPVRIERRSRPVRAASIALVVLITAVNATSAVLLVKVIVTGQHLGPNPASVLLLSGAAIWGTNVIAFALWYWEFDRGGPVNRLEGISPYPDFMFPQMTAMELTPPGWGPQFADYLYLSFTNATAFSPTDVMPLARWSKLTMLVQSGVSLALGALVIARAVNILH